MSADGIALPLFVFLGIDKNHQGVPSAAHIAYACYLDLSDFWLPFGKHWKEFIIPRDSAVGDPSMPLIQIFL